MTITGLELLAREYGRPVASDAERERAAWLEKRRGGIGSSDCAAVLGLDPYRTALEIYLDKTGQAPPRDESEPMAWGTRLESPIADAYAERTGEHLHPVPLTQSDAHPWMLASCDRMTSGGKIVEIKNVGWRQAGDWGPEDSDHVPTTYLLQVQHQLAVTGAPAADLAVLIGGQELRIYPLRPNARLIERLVERERRFWLDHVMTQIPPAPDWTHRSTPALLKALYTPSPGRVELGTSMDLAHLECYRLACEQIAAAQKTKAGAQARLTAAMGCAEEGAFPDGTLVRRAIVKRRAYEVAESEYTSFRVTEPKARKA